MIHLAKSVYVYIMNTAGVWYMYNVLDHIKK